jgi:hypothetical protein
MILHLFIAELNKLQVWSTDIGNAYLEAKQKKRWASFQDLSLRIRMGFY